MTRYANILNDDAFKVVIFTPGNEELMARMIEVLLPGKKIRRLEFRPTDHLSTYKNIAQVAPERYFFIAERRLRSGGYASNSATIFLMSEGLRRP